MAQYVLPLHLSFGIGMAIMIIGLLQRRNVINFPMATRGLMTGLAVMMTFISGLLPSVTGSFGQYPHPVIELAAVTHWPLWGVYGLYIYQKVHPRGKPGVRPVILGSIAALSLLHHANLSLYTLLSSGSLALCKQPLAFNAVYHFSVLTGIGITKSFTENKSGFPWYFIFIFIFLLTILINLQKPDVTVLWNILFLTKQLVYFLVLSVLFYFADSSHRIGVVIWGILIIIFPFSLIHYSLLS